MSPLQKGLIIYFSIGIPTGIIFYFLNIKGLDIISDILIGNIFGLAIIIILLMFTKKLGSLKKDISQ
jgi:hypothetical protein